VSIGVLHQGEEEVTTIPLVREVIKLQTVLGDHYNDDATWNYIIDEEKKIGYIRLSHFSQRSAGELRDALADLEEAGAKALILDLRFNPGGLLTQAIEIADLFLEEGTIVSTKGRNSPERSWSAHDEDSFYEQIPMVVLINRFSASASEILSACLQDHDRATIIGERSWGKGSVQNVIPLDGDKSALKLTTASYHRPSGKNIHKFPGAKKDDEWGVMPTEEFRHQMTKKEIEDYFINRKSRDVIGESEVEKPDFVDPHLKMALDHLSSVLNGGKEKPEKESADSPQAEESQKTEEEKTKTE
jgi:carboxyl-terminal processing protease